ncbi:MAG: hypothetical protein ACTSUE_27140 [Promethearchaeota archaeon]
MPLEKPDPEKDLPFKLKRQQFNHRIPELLTSMFDEFGEEKKYLLEYLLFMVCKTIGSKISGMAEYEVGILEIYINNVKSLLAMDDKFGTEFRELFSLEAVLDEKLKAVLARKAQDYATKNL